MNAIRLIEEIKSDSIKVDIPPEFNSKTVEIIILPFDEAADGEHGLSEQLLEAPTLTDDELSEFERVRDWMNSWNVKEF